MSTDTTTTATKYPIQLIAEQVAAVMTTQPWTLRPPLEGDNHGRFGAWIDGPPEMGALAFSTSYNGKGRISLAGSYPSGYTPGEMPSITVAGDATPEKIARAIERRLMPKYLEVLADARTAKAKRDDQDAKLAAVMAQLKEAIGPEAREGYAHGRKPDTVHGSNVKAQVRYDGSTVTLTLDNLQLDAALKLIAAARPLPPGVVHTETKTLHCPHCGASDIQLYEDLLSYRDVLIVRNGAIEVDPECQVHWEDADNSRFSCQSCYALFCAPEGLTIDEEGGDYDEDDDDRDDES